MLKVVLVILAVAGVSILVGVMAFGSARSRRMEQFVRERGGAWSLYDSFDLQGEVDALFGRGEWWVGGSGRLDGSDLEAGEVFLLDLHPEPDAPPRRTALLTRRTNLEVGGRLVVREPLEPAAPDEPDRKRFELVEGDLPERIRSRLAALALDRDWLLECRIDRDVAALSSRERPLSDRAEWRRLVEAARHLDGARNSPA